MLQFGQLYLITAAIAGALVLTTVWSRRRVWPKLFAVVLAASFLPTAYASMSDLMSRPKPVHMEWYQREASEADVLSANLRPEIGIFLLLQTDQHVEPRYYVLPWDQDMAQSLQDAMEEAERNGSGMRMRLPFEPSLDHDEPLFYALPQPKLPDKPGGEAPGDGPMHFRAPGIDA